MLLKLTKTSGGDRRRCNTSRRRWPKAIPWKIFGRTRLLPNFWRIRIFGPSKNISKGEYKMAAEPIPMPEDSPQVTINPDDTVVGQVNVNNGGVVKFQVSSYPTDPSTGAPYNTCIVTISPSDISWETLPI